MANGETWEQIRNLTEADALDVRTSLRLILAAQADLNDSMGELGASVRILRDAGDKVHNLHDIRISKLENDNKWIVGRDLTGIAIGVIAFVKSFFM